MLDNFIKVRSIKKNKIQYINGAVKFINRKTENTMSKIKRTKGSTMEDKTIPNKTKH